MKQIALITGSTGLIGFDCALLFLEKGYEVIGIDNNLREKQLHIKTLYDQKLHALRKISGNKYKHYKSDIRNKKQIETIFKSYGKRIKTIIHTAAQTSHEWAQKDPFTDFSINATGTLNLLDAYRRFASQSVFIFTSTNKVYGDLVNAFDFRELATRYDLDSNSQYYNGINEKFSMDQSKHSLFGVSKASADLLVQEYGRYFRLKTGVFRLGVITGRGQSGALEQGFLSYLLNRLIQNKKFTIIGYKGKQVRDIMHAKDVAKAFYIYAQNPGNGEVYNLGGGRGNSISILELIGKIYHLTGKKLKTGYMDSSRQGDHQWWITDSSKFQKQYPEWKVNYSVNEIILDIYNSIA